MIGPVNRTLRMLLGGDLAVEDFRSKMERRARRDRRSMKGLIRPHKLPEYESPDPIILESGRGSNRKISLIAMKHKSDPGVSRVPEG